MEDKEWTEWGMMDGTAEMKPTNTATLSCAVLPFNLLIDGAMCFSLDKAVFVATDIH